VAKIAIKRHCLRIPPYEHGTYIEIIVEKMWKYLYWQKIVVEIDHIKTKEII
jgi:hypothetical protein